MEQLDHPDVRSLVRRAEEVILASGKPMGTVPSAGASWQELFARGYRMVVGPHDVILLREAARAAWSEYRSFRGDAPTDVAPAKAGASY